MKCSGDNWAWIETSIWEAWEIDVETMIRSHVSFIVPEKPFWASRRHIHSDVKYLSKNTSQYYLSSFLGYLYFTIYIFDYFYFTTFLKKILYFLLHTFSLTPKSARYILNEGIYAPIPTTSDLADSLNTHDLFVNDVWMLCRWLSVNKKYKETVPSGLLNWNYLYL